MRGLTHRAVDQAAGLPEGSCSYYFRTRQSLLRAALERLLEADTAELPERPMRTTDIAAIVRLWTTGPAAGRMIARYELMLEASRRPELRNILKKARDHYHRMAEHTLTAAGAADPAAQAQLFIAAVDGLVFRHLTGADPLATNFEDALLDLMRGLKRI